MDNIKTWPGLPAEESIRVTEDRDKWRKYVYVVADPRIENGYGTELQSNPLQWTALGTDYTVSTT